MVLTSFLYLGQIPNAQVISQYGESILSDTLDVVQGWNLIGSISVPIPVGNIGAETEGLTASHFFGYANGYTKASTIEPGYGYWMKANKAGRIVLSAAPSSTSMKKLQIVSTNDLPPAPPGEIENKNTEIPAEFGLAQNHPNPFNPVTMLQYQLPVRSRVRLTIANMLGQVVQTLTDGIEDGGNKRVEWDALNFASGIYFYRLEATSTTDPSKTFTQVRKMILIR